MRTTRTALAASTVTLALLSGCSSDSDLVTTPDIETPSASQSVAEPDATESEAAETAEPEATTAAPTKAPNTGVGASFTIEGNGDPADRIKVTLLRIVDPAKSTDGFSTPEAGSRFVAIQFTVTNVGEAPVEDSFSNGSNITDTEGQQFDTTFAEAGGVQFPSSIKLGVGKTSKGFLTYELPKSSKIASVQFGTDSGFGETAEWTIRK